MSTDCKEFSELWLKACRWLDKEEFHEWLCFCYGAMSMTENRALIKRSIAGQIYTIISLRKRKS